VTYKDAALKLEEGKTALSDIEKAITNLKNELEKAASSVDSLTEGVRIHREQLSTCKASKIVPLREYDTAQKKASALVVQLNQANALKGALQGRLKKLLSLKRSALENIEALCKYLNTDNVLKLTS
jgi:chromosome segregation ATPase